MINIIFWLVIVIYFYFAVPACADHYKNWKLHRELRKDINNYEKDNERLQ